MHKRIAHSCSVCGSDDATVFCEPHLEENDPAKLYGAASGIQGTQRLVKCENCGLIYESPRFEAAEIIKGYQTSEDSGHDSQYHMRVRSFRNALQKQSKHIPAPGARILDVGTAGGAFLEAAEDYGYDSVGLEPSADLTARAQSRGLNVVQGTIEVHSFELGSFDMICLWDVIEHVPDPKAALVEIRALLKPDGVVLINYPDIGTWQAKLAGKRFWWILSVHLHHFSRPTLAEICRRTGFEVFRFQRYWQVLEFGYLEQMAAHYGMPLAKQIHQLTPKFIRNLPIPYYASQTTALARVA